MKFVRCALMIAASLVLPACNDDSGPTAPMAPTAPVQYPQVAGTWHGTVTYQALVGFYVDPPCAEQPVTLQLQQQGRSVSGTIQAECVTAQFSGTVYDQTISGRVTQAVNGQNYSSTLSGSLVGSPVSQMEAGTQIFLATSSGYQREAFQLRLTR